MADFRSWNDLSCSSSVSGHAREDEHRAYNDFSWRTWNDLSFSPQDMGGAGLNSALHQAHRFSGHAGRSSAQTGSHPGLESLYWLREETAESSNPKSAEQVEATEEAPSMSSGGARVTAIATSMDEPSLLVVAEDGVFDGSTQDVEGDFKTLNELSWRSGGPKFRPGARRQGSPELSWLRGPSPDVESDLKTLNELSVKSGGSGAGFRALNELSWKSSGSGHFTAVAAAADEPSHLIPPSSPLFGPSRTGDAEAWALNDLSWRTWNDLSTNNFDLGSSLARFAGSKDIQASKFKDASKLPGLGGMEWEAPSAATASSSTALVAPASGLDSVDAGLDSGLSHGLTAKFDNEPSEQSAVRGLPLRVSGTEASVDGMPVNAASAAANPGSVGHPELCTRPCLYFAVGQCSSTETCEFCHLFHPRRPARLDKRHRERFERLSVPERVAVLLPILREKSGVAGLSTAQLQRLLSKLAVSVESTSTELQEAEKIKISRSLKAALDAMSLRYLLTMLDCAPDVPPVF